MNSFHFRQREPLAAVHGAIATAVPTVIVVEDIQKRGDGNYFTLESPPPIYTSTSPPKTSLPPFTTTTATTTNSIFSTSTKPSKTKPTRTAMAPTSTTYILIAAPGTSPLPDSMGDTALFGRPSVVAGYNLTASILINSAFCLAFLVAICVATVQRARLRRQYRREIQKAGSTIESGKRGAIARSGDAKDKKDPSGDRDMKRDLAAGGARGQGPEMSMNNFKSSNSLQKKGSLSERALVADMGPAGGVDYNQRAPAQTYDSSALSRQSPQRNRNVRFNDGRPSAAPVPSRTQGNATMTASQEQEAMRGNRFGGNEPPRNNNNNSRGPLVNPRLDYLELDMEDARDTADYSLPPLAPSSMIHQDGYHSGFLDVIQGYDYLSPAVPYPGKPDSASTLGTGQSNFLNAASPDSRATNPTSNNTAANSGPRAKPSPTFDQSDEEYPIPILRSKSTRLPNQMREGPSMQSYATSP